MGKHRRQTTNHFSRLHTYNERFLKPCFLKNSFKVSTRFKVVKVVMVHWFEPMKSLLERMLSRAILLFVTIVGGLEWAVVIVYGRNSIRYKNACHIHKIKR
jgi:hypothetical protein